MLRLRLLSLTFLLPVACFASSALQWDAVEKEYHAKAGDAKAGFEFIAHNTSQVPIVIDSVTTSCGCTAAGFPAMPWRIGPGESSVLQATVDFHGRWGQIVKTITVASASGNTTLTVKVDAGAPAKSDVAAMMARTTPVGTRVDSALIRTVQEIADETDEMLRYQQIEDCVGGLTEKQYPIVLNLMLLPDAPSPGLVDLAAKVFRRWTEQAPDRAAEWLRGVPDGTVFGRQVYAVAAEAKAQKDPAGAVAWLKTLPAGGNRRAAQFAVAGAIAPRDPKGALALALALPADGARDGLLSYCVLNWSTTDFAAAAKWVAALVDPTLRDRIAARLATQEAVQNAPQAAQFAVATIHDPATLNHTVSDVVHFWAAATPEPCAEWVERLPDAAVRTAATQALLETWNRKDPAAARGWIAKHAVARTP